MSSRTTTWDTVILPGSCTNCAGEPEKGHTVLWDAGCPGAIREALRHNAAVMALAFSPDGEQLLSASRDWRAYLSDVRKPAATPRCKLKHLASVRTALFSPDGKLVLTGSTDGRGRLWDATSGEPVGQPLAFQANVHSTVFSADGRSVALAGDDTAARVWDVVRPPAPPAPFTYPESLYAAAFSRDGTVLATAGEGEGLCPIRLWDAATGQLRRVLPGHRGTVRDLAFSGDGTRLASAGGDGHARVWEVATGKTLQDFAASPDWTTAVAFSPDGRLLLVATRPGDVALWDLAAGQPRMQLPRHTGSVLGAAFSPDGTCWLTGCMDLTARLGTTADGQAVGVPLRHQGQVWSVSFSPDGRLALTGSDDRAVRGWEAETSRPLGAPWWTRSWSGWCSSAPTGGRSSRAAWWTARGCGMWPRASRLGPVLPHPDAVYAAHFTPDGRHVLLAGERLARPGTRWSWRRWPGRPTHRPPDAAGRRHGVAIPTRACASSTRTLGTRGANASPKCRPHADAAVPATPTALTTTPSRKQPHATPEGVTGPALPQEAPGRPFPRPSAPRTFRPGRENCCSAPAAKSN